MLFYSALECAQNSSAKIERKAWNGKAWVCCGSTAKKWVHEDDFWNTHARKFAEFEGGAAYVSPYMIMKTPSKQIQMGWTPSQEDLFADDWVVLEATQSAPLQPKPMFEYFVSFVKYYADNSHTFGNVVVSLSAKIQKEDIKRIQSDACEKDKALMSVILQIQQL